MSVNECNPVWMRFPASPYTSSIIEERLINLDDIRQQWEKLKERFSTIVVEGVVGMEVTRSWSA